MKSHDQKMQAEAEREIARAEGREDPVEVLKRKRAEALKRLANR